MVSDAALFPAAVGLKVTLITQLPPGARLAPQVLFEIRKSEALVPVTPMLLMASGPFPVFDRVTVFAALVEPTIWFPKARDDVLTPAIGYGSCNSTAPISIDPPGTSGLGLPKKSVDGATAAVGEVCGTRSTTGEPD